jgi:mono/diheme cytochrome c family protein
MGLATSLAVMGATVALISCAKTGGGGAAAMTPEQKIARGRYISQISACNDCHTPGGLYGAPDTTRLLSGSELGWQGPWGVSYPRNLTPDPETGIGSWTEEQIMTAFRTGHRPDGSPLLPPMPWPMYAHLSDEDAAALAAYLKSIPPVKHKAPAVIPPGQPATGPMLTFPPPPEWDARNLPPPSSTPATPMTN